MSEIAVESIIPDRSKSINKGGIVPIGELRENFTFAQLRGLAKKFKFSLADPLDKLSDEIIDIILHGTDEAFPVTYTNYELKTQTIDTVFKGIIPIIEEQYYEGKSESLSKWAEEFMHSKECPVCNGARLKQEALNFKIDNYNIAQLSNMSISELSAWLNTWMKNYKTARKSLRQRSSKKSAPELDFFAMWV